MLCDASKEQVRAWQLLAKAACGGVVVVPPASLPLASWKRNGDRVVDQFCPSSSGPETEDGAAGHRATGDRAGLPAGADQVVAADEVQPVVGQEGSSRLAQVDPGDPLGGDVALGAHDVALRSVKYR